MSDTFVLFVDILGFAALVEAAPAAVEQLRHELFHSQSTVVSADQAPVPPDVLLIRRFSAFHLHLQERLTELQGGDVTSIIFSDSAFIQSDSAEDVTRLSIGLMTTLLTKGVPVRMGLAAGTFRALRFALDSGPSSRLHVAEFLGTAVVRAHRAEHCGIRGLRILLDPSMEPHVDQLQGDEWIVSRIPVAEESSAVGSELNFVSVYQPGDGSRLITNHTELRRAVKRLRNEAPADKVDYYDNTLGALARMEAYWNPTE